MKTILKTVVFSFCTGALLFMLDIPPEFPLRVGFVPEAHAVLGVRRRTRRRTAVIVGSAAAVSAASASAAAQSQPAAAPAPAPTPAPAADGKPLPLGTVVPSLPAGCTSTPVDGIDYQYCGGNFYRAVFQGNTLVYVTARP